MPGSIILVGQHCVGKTTLARLLSRICGGRIVEMGDGVRMEAARLARTDLSEVAEGILQRDPDFLSRMAIRRCQASQQPVLIVGPRTPRELDFLIAELPDSITVGVLACDPVRHARWSSRPHNFTDTWAAREHRESVWGTANLARACDVQVSSEDRLSAEARQVLIAYYSRFLSR